MKKYIKCLLMILLTISSFAVLSACSSGSSSSPQVIAGPTVEMISPIPGSSNVTLIPSIELQFNQAVNNVTNTTITLHANSIDGDLIPITNITASAGNIYSFTPVTSLALGTSYYVVLSNGITSVNTNVALSATNFVFTTTNSPSLSVSMISPGNNSTNVTLRPTIQLQFNQTVNNVNTETVTLYEESSSGTSVVIDSITSGANNTYSFTPHTILKQNTKYFVVLSDGIISATSGQSLATTTFTFTTTTELVNISVEMIRPSESLNVELQPAIVIQFNQAVDNVTPQTVILRESSLIGTPVAIA